MKEKNKKGNICGIIALCLFWIPIAGFTLGIISVARKEDTPALGIIAIILSVLMFIVSLSILI